MLNRTHDLEEPVASHSSVDEVRTLLKENRAGKRRGIYSVCSANRLVLEAAIAQAADDRSPLLIEATCNQVNQEGGYTGMTPAQFRDYVYGIAREMHFPTEKLLLGGDHLGPNPWRVQSAETAMDKACAMISAYASAGFSKIHLDASMSCGDDPRTLASAEIADRAARLCEVAEFAAQDLACKPVYVIGTEVPTPGGAQEEMEIAVTTTASLQETLDVHREAFIRKGLLPVWDRMNCWLRFVRALSAISASRSSASKAESACRVESVPPWPVFIACNRSYPHSSRISPMMIRSGR